MQYDQCRAEGYLIGGGGGGGGGSVRRKIFNEIFTKYTTEKFFRNT
jgi:hypothetical protein